MKAAGPAAGLRIGEVYHGGNLAAARSRFADAPRPWLDLSTGINPEAYPVGELSRDAWTRLPEPSAIGELEAVAARAYGARDARSPHRRAGSAGIDRIVAPPPSGEPRRHLGHDLCRARSFMARRWALASRPSTRWRRSRPSRSRSWSTRTTPMAGSPRRTRLPNFPLALPARVACSSSMRPSWMSSLSRKASCRNCRPRERSCCVPSASSMDSLACGSALRPHRPRSLRASVARSALGPSRAPAIEIGRAALADRGWRDRAIGRLARGAARLDLMLRHAGFEIVGGTLLFRLARRAEASAWFERLGRQAILVRPFPAPHADWLRFGLPGTASEWRRLEAALSERERVRASSE